MSGTPNCTLWLDPVTGSAGRRLYRPDFQPRESLPRSQGQDFLHQPETDREKGRAPWRARLGVAGFRTGAGRKVLFVVIERNHLHAADVHPGRHPLCLDDAYRHRRFSILRMFWDDETIPSVEFRPATFRHGLGLRVIRHSTSVSPTPSILLALFRKEIALSRCPSGASIADRLCGSAGAQQRRLFLLQLVEPCVQAGLHDREDQGRGRT